METDDSQHASDIGPPGPDDEPDERLSRIRERPDGYHWIDIEGRQEFGPYGTRVEALAAMDDAEPAMERAIEQEQLVEDVQLELDIETRRDPGDADESPTVGEP